MLITVTDEHIEQGLKYDCNYCPVARAICAATGCDPWDVTVGGIKDSIRILECEYEVPAKVQDFIIAFDDGKDCVEPFTFELGVEEPA